MTTYETALASLNPEQKAAVTHIEGPLLVLAGPGTGKTQLLSTRAAYIMQTTDVRPQNILCLTFTEKAALNMRQRMISIIGPEASQITVNTFHGLGAEVIRQNPDSFWSGAQLEPAPDAVKLDVIDTLLNNLPLSNPLAMKFAGHNTLVKEVDKSIKLAKEAGLTPAKLAALCEANVAWMELVEPGLQDFLSTKTNAKDVLDKAQSAMVSMAEQDDTSLVPYTAYGEVFMRSLENVLAQCETEGKNSALSSWKSQWFTGPASSKVFKDKKRSEWWLELARVYDQYQSTMNDRGYFDFADMIIETIVQLEQNDDLRQSLQEKYSYIMVDEFQDTNDAQFRLVYLLSNHPSSEGRPNIMAVGDDDQAIYRFQGAEITNFETFMQSYKDVTTISLKQNYRSEQPIINTAQTIANHIQHRLVNTASVSKELVAITSNSKGKIEHQLYPQQDQQLTGVVETVKSMRTQENQEIAILARNHHTLLLLASLLQKRDVPVDYELTSSVLDQPDVQLLIEIFRALGAIQSGHTSQLNEHLATLLSYEDLKVPAMDLWQLATQNRQGGNWMESLLQHENVNLKNLAQWLLELAKVARVEPARVVVEYAMGLRTVDEDLLYPLGKMLTPPTTLEQLQSLTAMQTLRAVSAEFSRKACPSLQEFLEFIELHQLHGVKLSNAVKVMSGEQPVSLLTVHKAKGLEFDTVIVADAVESNWQPKSNRRKPPANLEMLQQYGEDMDDYGRLMFVAATRAKKNLVVTSYQFDGLGKETLATPLVEALPKVAISPQTDQQVQLETVKSSFMWPMLELDQQDKLLRPLLQNFQLSVTSLINYLDVTRGGPRSFLQRNLLRIPSVKTAASSFGTAMHSALFHAQTLVNRGTFTLDAVVDIFDQSLVREQLEIGEIERYREEGRRLLYHLFNEQWLALPQGGMPERHIDNIHIGQAVIRGALDRVEKSGGSILVTDYKTGTPLAAQLNTTNKALAIKAWRHRLQLTFYGLLLGASASNPVSGQMIYLQAQSPQDFSKTYTPTEDDYRDLRKLIEAVWSKIQALKFDDTSHYEQDYSGIQMFMSDLIKE